jgi:isochorismate synthase
MGLDLLAYRYPDKEEIIQSGAFKSVEKNDSSKDGFIIGDFYGKNQYIFKPFDSEDIKEFKLHFAIHEPNTISKKDYLEYGAMLLRVMPSLAIEKLVYSRVKQVPFEHTKTAKLFQTLCKTYPKAFVYLVSSELFGTWVGASPEILLESHESHGFTMSLAGTRLKDSNEEWGIKEYEEQKFVTDFIVNQLNSNGILEIDSEGPYTSPAGNIEHLRTDLSFDINAEQTLNLVSALHPTPATCGVPRKESLDLIESIELKDCRYDRDLYSGYIGEFSGKRTRLYVNLRCCQIINDKAFLYVGGGYTSESDPEKEWNETERKSETLTRIFDLL